MKKIIIPILNNEYKVLVVFGTNEERARYISKHVKGYDYEYALERCKATRGQTFLRLPQDHPLITIDIDLPYDMAFATIAHEASHAVQDIIDNLGIDDRSDEFKGHSISAIMRMSIRGLLGKKKLYAK